MALSLTFSAPVAGRVLRQPQVTETHPASSEDAARQVFGAPVMWGMCLAMGLYVGCEVAFSGWVTEFTRRTTGVNTAQAAITASIFWMALTFSRYFTNVMVRRVQPITLVSLLMLVSILGLIVMIAGSNVSAIAFVGAFAVGVGFGPIYSTLIAIGIQRFPFATQTLASVLTSSGSIGALFLPTLTGFVMNSPALGAISSWLVLAGFLLVIVVVWQLTRRDLARLQPQARLKQQIGEAA